MQIHKLGYKISQPDDLENYPQFLITLDDKQEPGSFLILPLELSMKEDGIYPIMNCGCGEWDCGGFYIDVKNTDEHVIWQAFYGQDGNKIKFPVVHAFTPIYFIREQYESVIKDLIFLKDKYKYEENVYKIDNEKYTAGGVNALDYMFEMSFK
jgi:hypothetical protein